MCESTQSTHWSVPLRAAHACAGVSADRAAGRPPVAHPATTPSAATVITATERGIDMGDRGDRGNRGRHLSGNATRDPKTGTTNSKKWGQPPQVADPITVPDL